MFPDRSPVALVRTVLTAKCRSTARRVADLWQRVLVARAVQRRSLERFRVVDVDSSPPMTGLATLGDTIPERLGAAPVTSFVGVASHRLTCVVADSLLLRQRDGRSHCAESDRRSFGALGATSLLLRTSPTQSPSGRTILQRWLGDVSQRAGCRGARLWHGDQVSLPARVDYKHDRRRVARRRHVAGTWRRRERQRRSGDDEKRRRRRVVPAPADAVATSDV